MAKETDVKDEPQKAEADVDYKAKFEQSEKDHNELQSQFTKVSQDAKRDQETLALIAENNLVDWDKLNKPEEADGTPADSEPDYIDKKTLEKKLADTERRLNVTQTLHEFRMSNPDLASPKYERIVVAELQDLVRENTRAGRLMKTRQELMVDAVNNTRKFLEAERAKGSDEAEDKKKKEAEASGLSSEGSTTPARPDDSGESVDDYVTRRKKQYQVRSGM